MADISEFALPDIDTASSTPTMQAEVPSYLIGADNHNYGNNNSSWLDPSTWDPVGTVVGAGKFAAVSLASGLNSFYNTGVTVGNWLGAELEQNDISVQLSAIDDDLGVYYKENKESADLVGFIATSLIPGIGSVKILNAGQKALAGASRGWVGYNMSEATGLAVPAVEKYMKLAAADLAQSSATFSALNANTLKALGAGFGQAALESAVFEVAVTATMFKSPILEKQDFGDIISNIAIGTVLGGALQGVFIGAKTYSGVKKAVTEADKAEKPFTHITEVPLTSASDRIITRFDDLDTMRAMPIEEGADLENKYIRLSQAKESRLMNLAREDVHKMTKGSDAELSNIVADSLMGQDSKAVMSNLLHSKDIARFGAKLDTETTLMKAFKELDTEAPKNLKVGYVKLIGEDAGNMTFTPPAVRSIADSITGGAEEVLKVANKYKDAYKTAPSMVKVANHTEAEARYILADRLPEFKPGTVIDELDIPKLEKAFADKNTSILLRAADGSTYPVDNTQALFETIISSKTTVAEELLASGKFTTEEIAKITNTKLSYLEGERASDMTKDLFARQDLQKTYTQAQIDKGLWTEGKGLIDISTKPTGFKIGYDTSPVTGIDANLVEGMAYIKSKQKVYQNGVDNVFAEKTGELADQFYHPDEKLLLQANRYGAGPGLFSFANGNYHSLESWAETTGAATNRLIKARVDAVTERLDSVAYKLANNQKAAIEFESINNKIAATTEKYVLSEDGTELVSRKIRDYRAAIEAGESAPQPKLQEGAAESIPISSIEAQEAIAAHIEVRGKRTSDYKELYASQGLEDMKDAGTFYPIRPNPKDYPFFAFVKDDSVTGVGHMSMIHAASERELEALLDRVPANYRTITKKQTEDYFRAVDDYQYDRTLHENYIDSDLKSRGVNTAFFQKTDPQKIAKDFVTDHTRGEAVFSRELVSAKFEKEFTELRRLGEQYTNVGSSQYGGNISALEHVTKNPYLNYVKTSLDISQMSEYPLLQGFNTILDKTFSRVMEPVSAAWNKIGKAEDLELVNAELTKAGVKSAFYDAATNALANHSAPQGALKNFVGKANSIISTLVLRLDPLNAINNAVGANVLLGAETASLVRAINRGDSAIAGELAALAKVKVPGVDETILAPSKLIANSMSRYFGEGSEALIKEYKANGWITSITDQYKSMLDDLTLRGNESATDLNSRINSAFTKAKQFGDIGERVTGNKLAEEFNRFVAADVMKQISDLGIKAGLIDEAAQKSYINTFINRTQGNILASQRPLAFQGAVGQAIGLFQTYQFNMIQQMLRYVGEGKGKDVATLLGLQGTMYGMNGLPAFNFINQHIVGTASGNPEHKDIHAATYGIAGKQLGDWLLYGAPSNMLQTNLYTRGDINPRQVTILPVNPVDVPLFNATGNFFANLKDTTSKIANGGNVWETMLQGIEHNSLNRPLAGLAQTLQGFGNNGTVYSTNKAGNILGANDMMSLTTIARLAGGKPFDEAIANDQTYRIAAYKAVDKDRKDKLAEAIKSSLIGGNQPSPDQMNTFIGKYTELGGKQKDFNSYMMGLYKTANTAQANKIAEDLKSPYSKVMQQVMGGEALLDGRRFTAVQESGE